MNPPRWPMVLLGIIIGLIGLPLLLGGAAAVTAQRVLHDANGGFSSPAYRLSTASDAVVLDNVDLDDAPPFRPDRWGVTVRIAAQGTDARPVFVGIASQSEIATYLTGVAHERITDVRRTRLDTRPVLGSREAGLPADQAEEGTGEDDRPARWLVHCGILL